MSVGIGSSRPRPDTAKPRDGSRGMTLTITQYPDHTAQVGMTVFIDDDPFIITDIKPQRESGVILGPIDGDGYRVVPRIVVVTIERYQEAA